MQMLVEAVDYLLQYRLPSWHTYNVININNDIEMITWIENICEYIFTMSNAVHISRRVLVLLWEHEWSVYHWARPSYFLLWGPLLKQQKNQVDINSPHKAGVRILKIYETIYYLHHTVQQCSKGFLRWVITSIWITRKKTCNNLHH